MPPENLQYPIGRFTPSENYSPAEINGCINRIESFPDKLDAVVAQLAGQHLDRSYRPGGWTCRQVIHHLADSHMNAYIRCKWILTEDTPVIKAYNEKAWAGTEETRSDPALSVRLIRALHHKWVALLRSLSADQLERRFVHPETQKTVRLADLIALYAWHGEHHLAHLRVVLRNSATPE